MSALARFEGMPYAPSMNDEHEEGGDVPKNGESHGETGEEPRFSGFNLTFFAELSSLELEDDLPEGTVIEVMRELSKRLADLADYYEEVGTSELFD
jgi:hypothetical protein